VGNLALKGLVEEMVEAGLSPKTVNTCSQVVKSVVASAVNEEGEQLFPRKWNHEFVDMPAVDISCMYSTRKEKRSKKGPRPRLTGFEERRTQATFDENPASDNRTRRELACQLGSQVLSVKLNKNSQLKMQRTHCPSECTTNVIPSFPRFTRVLKFFGA
jgi:hypothetical protein